VFFQSKQRQPHALEIALAGVVAGVAIPISNMMPIMFGPQATEVKKYTDFWTFYRGPYTQEHLVTSDQIAHVIIFATMLIYCISHQNIFIPWIMTLASGIIITRPLLSQTIPWLESAIMLFVGISFAHRYGVTLRFFLVYNAWLLADYTSHVYLGQNGPAALFIGQHYLSWGLTSQAVLFIQLLLQFVGLY